MSSRKDELLAKKARLAELKRQRELRQEQLTTKRQSIGEVSEQHDHQWTVTLTRSRLRHPAKLQMIEDLK